MEGPIGGETLLGTHRMVQEFSNLLEAVSDSVADDGVIDADEARRIREEWQRLKRFAEAFVVACEQGRFAVRR